MNKHGLIAVGKVWAMFSVWGLLCFALTYVPTEYTWMVFSGFVVVFAAILTVGAYKLGSVGK
jgi:hypothetical protein